MEAEAIHDFLPTDPSTELEFRQGDKLLILNYGDPVHWFEAEKDGRKGLVPENYIQMIKPDWYMGRITRATAENILAGNKVEGAFLVRLSESSPHDFSLSVKCTDSVQHFRVLKDADDGKYFLWSTKFPSINALVDNYRTESISRNSVVTLHDMDSEHQFVVQALYDFQPEVGKEGETELEFRKGDLITVFDTSDENWWGGQIASRQGYFPRLYVKAYQPEIHERKTA